MNNKFWYLANRTAFGIRDDGNLVFAMGHHMSTKDWPRRWFWRVQEGHSWRRKYHNLVCNFYFRNEKDKIVKREKLSPEQLKYTLNRYDQGYAKDFFAFYEK